VFEFLYHVTLFEFYKTISKFSLSSAAALPASALQAVKQAAAACLLHRII
jgi:hypothetical protein